MRKKKTVGQSATELMTKAPESRDPIELERAMQGDYIRNLIECVEVHKKIFPGGFFVVVITKNERLLPNVFRNYFSARESCPTPDYDQTVYAYSKEDDRIEYVWTIPSRDACQHLLAHKNEIVPEEQMLLGFVIQFANGTLYRLAKKFNGEQEDSPLLDA